MYVEQGPTCHVVMLSRSDSRTAGDSQENGGSDMVEFGGAHTPYRKLNFEKFPC